MVSGWYYSLRSRFRKITLFLNFWAVFVHFAKNQTRPLFLSKFRYYLIFGPNKWFPVDITLFEASFVKQHFSLIFGQFSYTLPKPNSPIFLAQIYLLPYHGTKQVVSNWYYSFRCRFHKIILFLNFRTVLLHFAQNKTHLFFCPNFVIILSLDQISGFFFISQSSQ